MIVTFWASIFLGLAVICFVAAVALARRDAGTAMVWALASCIFGVLGAFVGFRG